MGERPELPRQLTDAHFWRGVIGGAGWRGIDDKALFRAFMDLDPSVEPDVFRGVLDHLLKMVAGVAVAVAKRRGLSDERQIAQVKRKVLDEVRLGIALPRSSVGRGLREAAFGRVVYIAMGEVRKIWRRNRRATEREVFQLWTADRAHDDAPDRALMRKDVLRALNELATPAQRRTIELLIHGKDVEDIAACENACKKTIHNRVKAFVRLYHE